PWTEGVDWNSGAAHPGIPRRIQRNNFYFVPATSQRRGRLLYRFDRTAEGRINRVRGSENFHPECERPRAASHNAPARPRSTNASNEAGRAESRRAIRSQKFEVRAVARRFLANPLRQTMRGDLASSVSSAEQIRPSVDRKRTAGEDRGRL